MLLQRVIHDYALAAGDDNVELQNSADNHLQDFALLWQPSATPTDIYFLLTAARDTTRASLERSAAIALLGRVLEIAVDIELHGIDPDTVEAALVDLLTSAPSAHFSEAVSNAIQLRWCAQNESLQAALRFAVSPDWRRRLVAVFALAEPLSDQSAVECVTALRQLSHDHSSVVAAFARSFLMEAGTGSSSFNATLPEGSGHGIAEGTADGLSI